MFGGERGREGKWKITPHPHLAWRLIFSQQDRNSPQVGETKK